MNKVDSKNIPKVNSDSWNQFGFIKREVELFENSINQQVYDLFPMFNEQGWKIFNPS
jgi:hypothetical protein